MTRTRKPFAILVFASLVLVTAAGASEAVRQPNTSVWVIVHGNPPDAAAYYAAAKSGSAVIVHDGEVAICLHKEDVGFYVPTGPYRAGSFFKQSQALRYYAQMPASVTVKGIVQVGDEWVVWWAEPSQKQASDAARAGATAPKR